jgi:hypothetical protein
MNAQLSVVPDAPSFDQFYALYPRKEAVARARAMWAKLTLEEKKLALQAIPIHVKRWKILGTDKHMIPLPASWLNPDLGRRWEDEIDIPSNDSIGRNGHNGSSWMKTEAGVIEEFKRRGRPVPIGKSIDECRQILLREMR